MDCRALCDDMGAGALVTNVLATSSHEPLVERLFNVTVEGIANPISLVVVTCGASPLEETSSFDDG